MSTPPTPWTMTDLGDADFPVRQFFDANRRFVCEIKFDTAEQARAHAPAILAAVNGQMREIGELILRLDADEGLNPDALASLQNLTRAALQSGRS